MDCDEEARLCRPHSAFDELPASSEDAFNRRKRVGQVVDAVDSLYVSVFGPADGADIKTFIETTYRDYGILLSEEEAKRYYSGVRKG